ncbi:MAG TPA: hypothetical protein PKD45_13670 [Flavobacteriales bacterium]|nr:hypothetical protein [Flavobacteriales bacterium]
MAPSPYWFSYRYRLNKQWNLRAAVGGNIYREDRPSMFADRDNYRIQKTQWGLRAGIEHAQELAKRWQVFYGLDLRSSWTCELNEERFSNGGYLYGSEESGSAIGPAVLLGIRFRITPRFNILTEASLALMSTTKEKREYSTPILGGEPKPDVTSRTTGLQSTFTPPLAVTATFAL